MILPGTTKRAALLLADIEWNLRTTTLAMIAIILIGAVVVAVVARWRRLAARGVSASDQLAEFRALYLEGAISKEEFEQLREVLGGALRRDLAIPPPEKKPETTKNGPIQPQQAPAPNGKKPDPPSDGVQPG